MIQIKQPGIEYFLVYYFFPAEANSYFRSLRSDDDLIMVLDVKNDGEATLKEILRMKGLGKKIQGKIVNSGNIPVSVTNFIFPI